APAADTPAADTVVVTERGGCVGIATTAALSRALADLLDEARDDLVRAEKMAALGSLAAGLAHEINTPIGTALTAASHLEDRPRAMTQAFDTATLKRSDAEAYLHTAHEVSAIIQSNIGRASELIDSFKQVAADQASDSRRTFNLGPYIQE